MKQNKLLALFAGAAIALFAGCGGKTQSNLDTKALVQTFATAEPGVKAAVERVAATVKGRDYQTAAMELANLSRRENLTPEQRRTLQDTLAKLQKFALENPPKSVSQLPMALPK